MKIGQNLSSIKKQPLKASPDSFEMDDSNSPDHPQGSLLKKPTDDQLLDRLNRTMESAIRHSCYNDAIEGIKY